MGAHSLSEKVETRPLDREVQKAYQINAEKKYGKIVVLCELCFDRFEDTQHVDLKLLS